MVILAAVFVGKENALVAKFFRGLTAKDGNKFRNYTSLFDDANRRSSARTELCYAVSTLAVQVYSAVLSESEIRIKFLASDKQ